jgi:hypothetical protein
LREWNIVESFVSAITTLVDTFGSGFSFVGPIILVWCIILAGVPAFSVVGFVHLSGASWFSTIRSAGISSPAGALVSRFSSSVAPFDSFLGFLDERMGDLCVKAVH